MRIKHCANKDATYLPSISNMYVSTLVRRHEDEREIPCLSKKMPVKEYLNHLRPDGVFYYPYALYSAGHAKDYGDKCMISNKSEETFIVGDSGGYQLGTGAKKYPWSDKIAQKNVQIDTLHWLEKNCQASMTLDLPPWAVLKNKDARKHGFTDFKTCFNATLETLDTFIKNREPGKTQFLNILQGSTISEIDEWYDAVIKYNDTKLYKERAFEGFALAGRQSYCFYTILRRLIILRDSGYLNNGPVIHCLGSGKLNNAPAFTRIQQILQKQTNSNVKITFDAASPYLSAANGKVYSNIIIKKDNVTFDYRALPGTKQKNVFDYVEGGALADHPVRLHFPVGNGPIDLDIKNNPTLWNNSPIVRDITYKDIFTIKDVKGTKKVCIDSLAYAVAMAHNVYMHIDGIVQMNKIVNENKIDTSLPMKYSKLDHIIQTVLCSSKPMDVLKHEERWLTSYTGRGKTTKTPISTDVSFESLFKQNK